MSEELKELEQLKSEYEESIIPEYKAAMGITMARIMNATKILEREWGYGIEDDDIKPRLKKFESVVTKWKRKQYPCELSTQGIRKYITDIAGIRIITVFQDEIYDVVSLLKKIPSINIIEENDYIEKPKPSGYRSYHMIVLVEIYSSVTEESKLIPVEIQIRDCTMDSWSRIEHKLKYKRNTSDAQNDFLTEAADDFEIVREKAVAKKNELKNPAD